MDGLSDSERQALEAAQGGSREPSGPDDLMQRAYQKSGIDPLEAHARRDRDNIMAQVQGPLIALGGLLLAAVGGWRCYNAIQYDSFSIGGLGMLVVGGLAVIGGLAGTIVMKNE